MISDSPPDRELEWTDEGIQSSKNLVNRLERYFDQNQSEITEDTYKLVERFIYNLEKNILNFNLNKCIANIYTLLNSLEKAKICLGDSELSKKVLICLFPLFQDYQNNYLKNYLMLKYPAIFGLRLIKVYLKKMKSIYPYKLKGN